MKEDKLDKEIAASLREKLVEASVPYELGAWEAFQKKRALRKRKAIAYWASGIAASLLLLAVGLNSINFSENEIGNSVETQLAESTDQTPDTGVEEFPSMESRTQDLITDSADEASIELKSRESSSNAGNPSAVKEDPKPQANPIDTNVLATLPEPIDKVEKEKTADPEKTEISTQVPISAIEKAVKQAEEKPIFPQTPLVAKAEEVEQIQKALIEKSTEESLAVAKAEESVTNIEEPFITVAPVDKQSFVAESDFPEIKAEKTQVNLGMGVTPGFGTVQGDNQMAIASTIGLGMLVDVKLPGKVTLGSGLAVNYLSQNAEQQSTVMAFGNSYPQTEKLEVRQMQVELPVFVKYPVTRNNSVAIQAGFSNFYAMNETATQENTAPQQVALYSTADAFGNSSVSFRQQDVTQNTPLENKSGKFYPFATLNLGVNLRVLETKGANYVIMPFYNYQVKQVSGYGDTFGLFGASFKMNFGGSKLEVD